VELRDPTTSKLIRMIDEHAADALAFDPEGERLATAGRDGVVRLWDARTGKRDCRDRNPGGVGVTAVAFAPDRQSLAYGTPTDGWCFGRGRASASQASTPAEFVRPSPRSRAGLRWRPPATTRSETVGRGEPWAVDTGQAGANVHAWPSAPTANGWPQPRARREHPGRSGCGTPWIGPWRTNCRAPLVPSLPLPSTPGASSWPVAPRLCPMPVASRSRG
jgi:hypothetical protein